MQVTDYLKHGLVAGTLVVIAEYVQKIMYYQNDVPYNQLHDQGYSSIGCTHCTLPSDDRDGRWAGTGKLECGIHG